MRQPNVTVYGSHSCEDTERTIKFLDAQQIPYEFKDVDESPEYNDYIAGLNNGKRVTPAVRINNETFINPAEAELAQAVQSAGQAAGA
jgi:glutaredoxin